MAIVPLAPNRHYYQEAFKPETGENHLSSWIAKLTLAIELMQLDSHFYNVCSVTRSSRADILYHLLCIGVC